MGALATALKIVFGLLTILLLLSVGYLILSSPQVQSFTSSVIASLNHTNPQLADFLSKLGAIVYDLCRLGYSITKPVIDALYNLLSKVSIGK